MKARVGEGSGDERGKARPGREGSGDGRGKARDEREGSRDGRWKAWVGERDLWMGEGKPRMGGGI